MSARSLAIAALIALSPALPRPTAAAESTRVVLIPSGAGDPVTARLLDELVALGLVVEVSPPVAGDLALIGRSRGASAVVRVSPSSTGPPGAPAPRAVDLWVAPAATVERVAARADEPGGADAGLALRAVELLRGRLLRVDPAQGPPAQGPPAPAPSTPSPPEVSAPAPHVSPPPGVPGPDTPPPGAPPPPAHRPRIALHVGPGLVLQPGSDISTAGTAVAGATWMITQRVGGDFVVLVPVVPGLIESPQGRARISAVVIGAGVWLSFVDPGLPVDAGVGAGVSAGFLSYYGQPESPDVRGLDGTVPYALPYARAGLLWRVLSPLGVRADVLAGVSAPRPVIRLAGRDSDVAFGRPLLAVSLGLEVSIR